MGNRKFERLQTGKARDMIRVKWLLFVFAVSMVFIFSRSYSEGSEKDDILYGVTKYLLLYYNPTSITRVSEDVVGLKIKVVSKCKDRRDWAIKEHPSCSNMDWDYVLTLTEINCSMKQDRDIESVGYDTEGRPVESLATETSECSDIDPDSYTEALYKLVCH